MEIINKDYWLKPFSTSLNCIDSKDCKCNKNVTLEQCIDNCKNDPFCQAGYYLHTPNNINYCINLNRSYLWNNIDLRNNFIKSDNNSIINKKNGYNMNVFVNPKRFPDYQNLPDNINNFIYTGNVIYLIYNEKYYLNNDFLFVIDYKIADTFSLIDNLSNQSDNLIRLSIDQAILLYQNNSYLHIYYNDYEKKFSWIPINTIYRPYFLSIEFDDYSSFFINENDKFYLLFHVNHNKKFYLDMDMDTFQLKCITSKPKSHFSFRLDNYNIINKFRKESFTIRNPNNDKYIIDNNFNNSLNNFLQLYYNNDKKAENNNIFNYILIMNIILIIGIIILWIIFYFIYRKKYNRTYK